MIKIYFNDFSTITNRHTGSLQYSVYRLFSFTGYIVNKTCFSLEPNTVNMLMCLPRWLSEDI